MGRRTRFIGGGTKACEKPSVWPSAFTSAGGENEAKVGADGGQKMEARMMKLEGGDIFILERNDCKVSLDNE